MEKPIEGLDFGNRLILASGSPRRKELLASLGLKFSIEVSDFDEIWPKDLPSNDVAEYLAVKKAESVHNRFPDKLVVTADTIVVLDREILEKPVDHQEAVHMLKRLSGRTHEVITGVCIIEKNNSMAFSDITTVRFKALTDAEIDYYVSEFQPFDKAGAYGIQEWIGMIGVEQMEGSYFNVMGLPVHKLYNALIQWYSRI